MNLRRDFHLIAIRSMPLKMNDKNYISETSLAMRDVFISLIIKNIYDIEYISKLQQKLKTEILLKFVTVSD